MNKWFGGSVLGECGEMMKMYKYTIAVYLCKTEALRMRYLGQGFCLEENALFLIADTNSIECQIDMMLFDSAKIVTALFV